MLKRDLLIILTCLGVAYIAFQRESWVQFKASWYTKIQDEDYFQQSTDTPASPVVGDLNGDGMFEVLVPTQGTKIKVIRPPSYAYQTSKAIGFTQANVIGEINLQDEQNQLRFTKGLKAIAIKVGYLDSAHYMTNSIRKQIVAVVTDGGLLKVYDHKFQKMWEKALIQDMPDHAVIKEVDIIISNYTLLEGDRGSVYVGLSIRNQYGVHRKDRDIFKESEHDYMTKHEHTKTHYGAENLTDVGGKSGVDVRTQFQMFAFNGNNGEKRWYNEGDKFHKDVAKVRDDVQPQQHYKLNAKSLQGRQYGEESCRNYRTSLLTSLPHRWRNLHDTTLMLAHYEKHKLGSGQEKKRLVQGHKDAQSYHNPHLAVGQPDGSVSRFQQGFKNYLKALPNKQATDNDPKTAKINNRLKSNSFQNLDYQNFKYRDHQYAHNYPHTLVGSPNVVVAYLRNGLQIFHMYTGQPICRVYLPPGGYNVDLDGDGIVDQVNSYGDEIHHDHHRDFLQQILREQQTRAMNKHKGQSQYQIRSKCLGWVNSGIPPTTPKFNQSICKRGAFTLGALSFGSAVQNLEEQEEDFDIKVATPVSLPVPIQGKYYRPQLLGQPHQILFLTSHGYLSSFTETGDFLWQATLQMELGKRVQNPLLEVIPLVQGGVPIAIVAGGDDFVEIITESGEQLDRIRFKEEALDVKFQDFTGDHLVDIIVVGRGYVYGYVQVRNPSSEPITLLILVLVAAMVLIYVSQNNQDNKLFTNLGRRVYKLEPKDD